MNQSDKLSIYRVMPCLGIVVSALVSSVLLCYINVLQFDESFCVFMVILGTLPVLFFEMIYERRRGNLFNNVQTTYGRIALGFFLCCILMLGVSFLPEFYRPVMLFPLIMLAYSNETIGLITGVFLNILLAMTTGSSFYELLAYCVMIIVATALAKALKQEEYRIYIGLIFLFVTVLFSSIFCYWTNEAISLTQFAYALGNGLVTCLYAIFIFPKNKEKTQEDIVYHYETLLTDDYSLLRELKGYSLAEYRHARKVSDIAYKYALKLNMRADLASVAGLYYRLGRLEGEPIVENGVKLAEKLCFPTDLVQILKEYNGEKELPSTPESALIHMIDGILLKIELLEKQVGTSQWNREVLIYQTLNEYSTAGLYDNSGLSINGFIKIREMLAKEELLS